MSRLILIRHAQASFSSDPAQAFQDYDRLSPLGLKQAEALGVELARAGLRFDRLFVGPADRHGETATAASAASTRRWAPWPDPVVDEDLAEHEGARAVERSLEQPGDDEELVRLRDLVASSAASTDGRRTYLEAFRHITRRWVRGELPQPEHVEETWQAFRTRVERVLRRIVDESGRGETVGVVTSAGPIGSTVAWALGLGDEAALELAWVVENATLTELLFSDERVSLKSFNTQPRLGSRDLVTYV